MTSSPSSTKNYENHYKNQRARILEAAEKLFIQKGINNVSVTAIAKSARMARVTLYEYFPNIEEIVWAIFQKLIEDWKSNLGQVMLPNGTGYQRIEHFMMEMVNEIENNPAHSRFIVEFNTLYATQTDASRILKILTVESNNSLIEIIKSGISDGSIRPDLDPNLTASAIGNLISGMNSRFVLLGNQINFEYGYSWKKIYHEIIQNFLTGIRSKLCQS